MQQDGRKGNEADLVGLYEGPWRSKVKVSTDIVLDPGGVDG